MNERKRQMDNCRERFKKKLDILSVKQNQLIAKYKLKFRSFCDQHQVWLNLKHEILDKLEPSESQILQSSVQIDSDSRNSQNDLIDQNTVNIEEINFIETERGGSSADEDLWDWFRANR